MEGMSMPSGSETFGAGGDWEHWLLMVLAMMLPVVAPHVRTVGLRSLWSRRHRSGLFHVLGYVALWAGAGALLVAGLVLLGLDHHGAHLLPVADLLLAAAWQVSVPRRRVLRRCASLRLHASAGPGRRHRLRPRGSAVGSALPGRVLAGDARDGAEPLTPADGRPVVVLLTERARGANPLRRAGRPLEGWVLAGFALAAGAAATILAQS